MGRYYKKLVGEKVYLSPLNMEDAEKYVEWFCDFSLTDGLGSTGKVENIESEKQWIENALKSNDYNFAIINLENDEIIGNCGLMNIKTRDRIGTIGIFIGDEKNRNKGYGAETVGLLLDYGFNYLNLNNIMLQVKSFNERAIACYKKLGFKEFGRRRQSYFLNGKYYDDVNMDILAEEFQDKYIKNRNPYLPE